MEFDTNLHQKFTINNDLFCFVISEVNDFDQRWATLPDDELIPSYIVNRDNWILYEPRNPLLFRIDQIKPGLRGGNYQPQERPNRI